MIPQQSASVLQHIESPPTGDRAIKRHVTDLWHRDTADNRAKRERQEQEGNGLELAADYSDYVDFKKEKHSMLLIICSVVILPKSFPMTNIRSAAEAEKVPAKIPAGQ